MIGPSSSARYAVAALVYLTRASAEVWVKASEISAATGVPRPYLVKMLHGLRGQGWVATRRGSRGGYRLDRPPAAISLLEIVGAVDGSRFFEDCLLEPGRCAGKRACTLHSFWAPERARLERRFCELTLASLAAAEVR